MAYISEIKSRDDPNSQSDYVEVVIGPTENAEDFQIALYSRNGNLRDTISVGDTTPVILPDGSRLYNLPIRLWEGSNQGGPAAVALTGADDTVLQFFAVGGTDVTANAGPAAGMTATAVGNSVQGESHYWRADGTYRGTFASTPDAICFAKGTRIKTDAGLCRIEDLQVGDKVVTRENGLQEIRWIGQRALEADDLAKYPNLRPIRIQAGSLGDGIPSRDLVVSPQHRIVVRSKIAVRMFDAEEVFLAAKHLLGVKGIKVDPDLQEVTYFHLLCDDHEIIEADGAFAETLYTGSQAMKALSPEAKAELSLIFGDIFSTDRALALIAPKGRQARQLVARHIKNNRAMYG